MEQFEILAKLLMTFIFALMFGLERQRSHKPISFGTFILVSIGSCTLSIVALSVNVENPFPLLAAIITGIGFLGAGALIKTSDKIYGFTTAAGIWVFAIFGMIMGLGEYLMAIILYGMIWIVLFIDKFLAKKGIGSYQKRMKITTNSVFDESKIRETLKESGSTKSKLISLDISKKDNKMILEFLVEGTKDRVKKIHKKLVLMDWVDNVHIE